MNKYKKFNLEDYPSLNEEQKIGLLQLINSRGYFGDYTSHGYHYPTPNAIFFTDISGTIYPSSPHGKGGLMNMDGEVNWKDIEALYHIMEKSLSQVLDFKMYTDTMAAGFDKDIAKVNSDFLFKYLIDSTSLPLLANGKIRGFGGIPDFGPRTVHGSFKTVFISSEDEIKQKAIIKLLLSLFLMLHSQHFIADLLLAEYLRKYEEFGYDLEKLFEYIDNDKLYNYERMYNVSRSEHSIPFRSFTKSYASCKKKVDEIINNATFIYAKEKPKEHYMKEYLDYYKAYYAKEGLLPNFVFAFGDSWTDYGMVEEAYLNGGLGYIVGSYKGIQEAKIAHDLHEQGINNNICTKKTLESAVCACNEYMVNELAKSIALYSEIFNQNPKEVLTENKLKRIGGKY